MVSGATSLVARKLPRQQRAQLTRDAIIEAAAHIIGDQGLAGYNTNAVAERAGVSIGSLYQYFPNKDALMVALIGRQQRMQAERLTRAFAESAAVDLENGVRVLVQAAMQHHRDNALLAAAIDHEEERLPVGEAVFETLEQAGGLVGQFLSRHAAETAGIDPEQASRTLPVMVRAVVDCWANRNPPRPDIAEAEAVRAVLGYLRG